MGTATIGSRVDSAAKALAVGDALSTEQLRVIFAPFIAAGFRSLPVAATPTEQCGHWPKTAQCGLW